MAGARGRGRKRGGSESGEPARGALRATAMRASMRASRARRVLRRAGQQASRRARPPPSLGRSKVLKMLAAMEQTPNSSREAPDAVEDFLTTGRTGRRNAMADILGEHASTGSGDLSERMEGLSTDPMAAGPSTSGASGSAVGQPKPAEDKSAPGGTTQEGGR